MTTPKQSVRRMLAKLDPDVSFEDIQYRIYALNKIQRGLNDIAAKRVASHDEVVQRFDAWAKRLSGRKRRRAS